MQFLFGLLSKFAGPFGWIINILMGFLWKKGEEKIAEVRKDHANHAEAVSQAERDTKKASELKPDATKEQVSEAIDDTLSHF